MKRICSLLLFLLQFVCVSFASTNSSAELQLNAWLSRTRIYESESLVLHVNIHNPSKSSVRILPFQRSLWSRLFITFEETVPGNPSGNNFTIGTLPRLAGIKPVVPVKLAQGASRDASIDLLTWQFYVYRSGSALDETPLFSFPGTYSFKVAYRIDKETSKAFNIPQVNIVSEALVVKVLPNPKDATPNSKKKAKWVNGDGEFIPHWMDIDGTEKSIPSSKEKISREERKRIETVFRKVLSIDAAKYKEVSLFDYKLRFRFHLADSGRLEFNPTVFPETHKALLSSQKNMATLRNRLREIESSLRSNGIDAHVSGKWGEIYRRCGNE